MPFRKPLLTQTDHHRLQLLIRDELKCAIAQARDRHALQRRLQTALVLDEDQIPASVVTMQSTVRLAELETNEIEVLTLVHPEEADIAGGKLSVFAPLGTAILGRHAGQTVRVRVSGGSRQFRIDAILFQPENAGPFATEGVDANSVCCPWQDGRQRKNAGA
jgi:regulator of nucleoside diphosphate kinase